MDHPQPRSELVPPPLPPRPVTALDYELNRSGTSNAPDPFRPIRLACIVGLAFAALQVVATLVATLIAVSGLGHAFLSSMRLTAMLLLKIAVDAVLAVSAIGCLQRREWQRALALSALAVVAVDTLIQIDSVLRMINAPTSWTGFGKLSTAQTVVVTALTFAQYVGLPVLIALLAWPWRTVAPAAGEANAAGDAWRPIRFASLAGMFVGVFQCIAMLIAVAMLAVHGFGGGEPLAVIRRLVLLLLNSAASVGLVIGAFGCFLRHDRRWLLAMSALAMAALDTFNQAESVFGFPWHSMDWFGIQLTAAITANFAQQVGFPILITLLVWPRRNERMIAATE